MLNQFPQSVNSPNRKSLRGPVETFLKSRRHPAASWFWTKEKHALYIICEQFEGADFDSEIILNYSCHLDDILKIAAGKELTNI